MMYHMMVIVCSVLSRISYRNDVSNADSGKLRQKVANHLEANAALYCDSLRMAIMQTLSSLLLKMST